LPPSATIGHHHQPQPSATISHHGHEPPSVNIDQHCLHTNMASLSFCGADATVSMNHKKERGVM
jgi:hypothetical protein